MILKFEGICTVFVIFLNLSYIVDTSFVDKLCFSYHVRKFPVTCGELVDFPKLLRDLFILYYWLVTFKTGMAGKVTMYNQL